MSRQVTISDTFDEKLHDLLLAALRYAQDPDSKERKYDYIHCTLYEYDTEIHYLIRNAVAVAIAENQTGSNPPIDSN